MELGSALPIKSLFLLEVVPEVIDPVMEAFQRGCINRYAEVGQNWILGYAADAADYSTASLTIQSYRPFINLFAPSFGPALVER